VTAALDDVSEGAFLEEVDVLGVVAETLDDMPFSELDRSRERPQPVAFGRGQEVQ
jgi:hypothetical protein